MGSVDAEFDKRTLIVKRRELYTGEYDDLCKRNILYSKPVFVQKYIVQHAAPKQNIGCGPP